MEAKFVLNPDEQHVKLINEGIKKYAGHCPCFVERTDDTICPCKEYRETGNCHCGKYIE